MMGVFDRKKYLKKFTVNEDNMGNKYSKASVTGFFLIMLSVLIGQFFIFNDAMFHVLGRDFLDQ